MAPRAPRVIQPTQPTLELSSSFWTNPRTASMMMTRKQLREVLIKHEGWLFIMGYIYDIKSKHLGAGAYRVHLEQRK